MNLQVDPQPHNGSCGRQDLHVRPGTLQRWLRLAVLHAFGGSWVSFKELALSKPWALMPKNPEL